MKKTEMKYKLINFKSFFALEFKILWCRRTHRVRFYIYVHAYVYVSNLRKLPAVDATRDASHVKPQ